MGQFRLIFINSWIKDRLDSEHKKQQVTVSDSFFSIQHETGSGWKHLSGPHEKKPGIMNIDEYQKLD